jgi:hypothetical protein
MTLKEPMISPREADHNLNFTKTDINEKDISLFEILTIHEFYDVVLMFSGFVAAIVTGASIPIFNVLMGQLINEINDENTGFGSSVTLLVHALLALAVINLCSGTIQVRKLTCRHDQVL